MFGHIREGYVDNSAQTLAGGNTANVVTDATIRGIVGGSYLTVLFKLYVWYLVALDSCLNELYFSW